MKIKSLITEIEKLKKEKEAIILAHYYQSPEIQDISDFVGDSFALSKMAKTTDAKVIVFCGVHFMAETAKILSPHKRVFASNAQAGCYLADCITEDSLKKRLNTKEKIKVIAYVNTSASVKALADVCVTSSNVVKIIKHYHENFPDYQLLYIPDVNLANYIEKQENVKLEKWPGYCDVHQALKADDVIKARQQYPDALLLTHPEAPLEVLALSDFVGSTSDIINFTKVSSKQNFIIGTECGILHQLQKESPHKNFYLLSSKLICQSMKMTTLEDVYDTLLNETGEIILDDDTIKKAQASLEQMLELGSK